MPRTPGGWLRLLVVALAVVSSTLLIVGVPVLSRPDDGGEPAPSDLTEPPPPEPRGCVLDPANLPPPPPRPDGRPANYLHTCGSRILDSRGNEVRITGINWFGMETGTYAPHGLAVRNYRSILDQVVVLGYNTIRLPLSNEVLHPRHPPEGINYQVNPELEGLSGLEVLDRIVAAARERGLKIVLDRHRPTPEAQSALWYTEQVSEEQWIEDWRFLARRYLGDDTVIGVDLHNEPREPATWGTGDLSTDWRLAAERAGNAILAENPYLLIFVQGVDLVGDDRYWWGGNLMGVREAPVRLDVPNRVVYTPHDYGPAVHPQPWFQAPDFPANLPGVWDRHWGYLHREGIAPVVLGELGGRSTGEDPEGLWQRAIFQYLADHGIGYIVWAINPNSSDTGGLLAEDWATVVQEKQALYRENLAPAIGGQLQRPPQRVRVLYRAVDQKERSSAIHFAVRVANEGPDPLPLHRLELRYWFTAGELRGREQQVVVDWADVGQGQV
ncbi:MAG TPA: cellulase family glycosylhydrolase, partial [Chloroflexota bacterium]